MWTSDTGAPYMVLTAHWINNEWDLKHVIIAFQRFPHPHTGEQIQEITLKILQEFSIATKASTITIDNGTNQVAGMKLLSTRLSRELQVDFNVIRCGAHTIALVVNTFLKKFFDFTEEMSGSNYSTLGTLLLLLDLLSDHIVITISTSQILWIKEIA